MRKTFFKLSVFVFSFLESAAFASGNIDNRFNALCDVGSIGFHVYASIEKLGPQVLVSEIQYAHVGYWYGRIAPLSCNGEGDCVGYVLGSKSLVRVHFQKTNDQIIANWQSEPAPWIGLGNGKMESPEEAIHGSCKMESTIVLSPR